MRYHRLPLAFAVTLFAVLALPSASRADVDGEWVGTLQCEDLRNSNSEGEPIARFKNPVFASFVETGRSGFRAQGTLTLEDGQNQFCAGDIEYVSVTTPDADSLVFFHIPDIATHCLGTARLRRDKKLVFTYHRVSGPDGFHQTCQGTLKRASGPI